MNNAMNLTVGKEDITRIGNTAFEQDGNLSIICSAETSNIEHILLRNILKCFGEQYKIVGESDFQWENKVLVDTLYETNLPYSMFQSVCKH